jgi:hypothetical protein
VAPDEALYETREVIEPGKATRLTYHPWLRLPFHTPWHPAYPSAGETIVEHIKSVPESTGDQVET